MEEMVPKHEIDPMDFEKLSCGKFITVLGLDYLDNYNGKKIFIKITQSYDPDDKISNDVDKRLIGTYVTNFDSSEYEIYKTDEVCFSDGGRTRIWRESTESEIKFCTNAIKHGSLYLGL